MLNAWDQVILCYQPLWGEQQQGAHQDAQETEETRQAEKIQEREETEKDEQTTQEKT